MARVGLEPGSFNLSYACLLKQGTVSYSVSSDKTSKVSEQESDDPPIGNFSPGSVLDKMELK